MGTAINSGFFATHISDDTRGLVIVRAKLAEVYNDLILVLDKIDENGDDESTQRLKGAMFDADAELMHYISKQIDIHLVESGYKQL